MKLKATKAMTYDTRRLLPGDVFEVPDNKVGRLHARLLRRKATEIREPGKIAPPPAAVAEKIEAAVAPVPVAPPTAPAPATVGAMTTAQMPNAPPSASDDRVALRAEYEKVLGKAPFPSWSADVLREKIAAAKTAS